jgi:hypothetical protein
MKQHNSIKSIDTYLVSVIEESIKATLQKKALQEKEKQDAVSGSDAESEKTNDKEKQKLKKGDVTVDDVIDKLNSIRSGKSFKEEKITAALSKYIDDLGVAERTALLAFLKGISQIVTGEISPETAIDPGDKHVDIEMKKTTGPQKVSVKPNVIKAPDIEKSKKSSAEDASGPVPIKAKK